MPPPPLPPAQRTRAPLGMKVLVALVVLSFATLAIVFGLQPTRVFMIPTAAMAPAIEKGDRILVENVNRFWRSPQRGDIVVFKTDGLAVPNPGPFYVKRIVGLPGETLSLVDGTLLINGVRTPLRNRNGEITYVSLPGAKYLTRPEDTVSVPPGHYFVLGDNSAHSLDSRFFGFVYEKAIGGRVVWCYLPLERTGPVQ